MAADTETIPVTAEQALVVDVTTNDPSVRAVPRVISAEEMAADAPNIEERNSHMRAAMLRAVAHDIGAEEATRLLHRITQTRLAELRATRDDLNARIRGLVEEERVLGLAVTRFDRIAADPTTSTPEEG